MAKKIKTMITMKEKEPITKDHLIDIWDVGVSLGGYDYNMLVHAPNRKEAEKRALAATKFLIPKIFATKMYAKDWREQVEDLGDIIDSEVIRKLRRRKSHVDIYDEGT